MTAAITIRKISATEFRVTVTADIKISGLSSDGQRPAGRAATGPARAGETVFPGQELLTVEQASKLLHISRDRVYYLLRTRQLRSIKIGRLRRISRDWIEEYIRRCESVWAPEPQQH